MPRNIQNDFMRQKSEYGILAALQDMNRHRFTDLHTLTALSPKTLSNNLRRLIDRGLVIKVRRNYQITAPGSNYLPRLRKDLDTYGEHRKRLATIAKHLTEYAVDVTRVTASGTFLCTFRVSLSRKLKLRDAQMMRSEMNRALTEAMAVIVKYLPSGARVYDVAMSGTSAGA